MCTEAKVAELSSWPMSLIFKVLTIINWLKKQPINQVPSTEWTMIYSKVLMSCGCHSFPKPV